MGQAALRVVREPAEAASALHPLRRRILSVLQRPGSATSVAAELGLPRQKVNYHVRQLESEGLIEEVDQRRRGNCVERVLRASARHLVLAPDLIGDLDQAPAHIQDRLSSAYLTAVLARGLSDVAELREQADAAGKKLATLSMETTVTFATPADQHSFAKDMATAIADVLARYHSPGAPDGRRFRLLMGSFPAPAPLPSSDPTPTTSEDSND